MLSWCCTREVINGSREVIGLSRLTEQEREALRIAAEAARPVLSRLIAERAALDAKIEQFRSIVSVYEDSGPRRAKKDGETAKRGLVRKQIDEVLAGGGDYTEPELRESVNTRFGTSYERATMYSALRRGLKKKRYELKEHKWRMKQT